MLVLQHSECYLSLITHKNGEKDAISTSDVSWLLYPVLIDLLKVRFIRRNTWTYLQSIRTYSVYVPDLFLSINYLQSFVFIFI